jgi:hypothetical protein
MMETYRHCAQTKILGLAQSKAKKSPAIMQILHEMDECIKEDTEKKSGGASLPIQYHSKWQRGSSYM